MLFIIVLVLFFSALAIEKLGGRAGCVIVLFLLFIGFLFSLDDYKKEDYERQQKLDEAVEQIRKTKQMYIDSGWVKPPKM